MFSTKRWKPTFRNITTKRLWRSSCSFSTDSNTNTLNAIANRLSVNQLEDWYQVKTRDFERAGGSVLLKQKGSLYEILKFYYPSHTWLAWKFTAVPPHFWDNEHNQRSFFEWASTQLGHKSLEDWYTVKTKSVIDLGGRGLLNRKYGGSLAIALQSVYPTHRWHVWKFDVVPRGYWTVPSNRRAFFEWVFREKLKLNEFEDWYGVNPATVEAEGGSKFMRKLYGGSLAKALMDLFPEYNWLPWRFKHHSVEAKYWDDVNNIRSFVSHLESVLGITSPTQWNEQRPARIRSLIRSFGSAVSLIEEKYNSVAELLQVVYPNTSFAQLSAREEQYTRGKEDYESRKQVLLSLQSRLKITQLEDWYNVTHEDLRRVGAYSLLNRFYGSSLHRALVDLMPEHGEWLPWKFRSAPRKFWQAIENRRYFFDHIAKDLGISKLEDWYSVNAAQVMQLGGHTLLKKYYGGSLPHALMDTYTEHQWELWRFGRIPRFTWENSSPDQLAALLTSLEPQLGVNNADDWYRVSYKQLKKAGISHIVEKFGGLEKTLRIAFPSHTWDSSAFTATDKMGRQSLMKKAARSLNLAV